MKSIFSFLVENRRLIIVALIAILFVFLGTARAQAANTQYFGHISGTDLVIDYFPGIITAYCVSNNVSTGEANRNCRNGGGYGSFTAPLVFSFSWLSTDGTYYINLGAYNFPGDTIASDPSSIGYVVLYRIDGVLTTDPAPPPENLTRVIEVFPPDDSPDFAFPYATSTAFDISGDIYVNPDDFVSGMVFRQTLRNNVSVAIGAVGPSLSEGGNLICSMLPDWLCPRLPGEGDTYTPSGTFQRVFEYPITADGLSSFATTTDIQQIGVYSLRSEIVRPQSIFGISIPGSGTVFASLFSQFMVVEPSSYDIVAGDTIRELQDLSVAASPECSFDFFTPSNYYPSLVRCIVALTSPAYDSVIAQIQSSMQLFLSHAPWGYGMRVYQIVTNETIATSTLPSMDFDFSMVGYDFAIDLTPWEHMMCPGSWFDTYTLPSGKNFLHEVLLPNWNILISCLWAISLLAFLLLRNKSHVDDD